MADDTQLGAPSGTGDVISTDDLGLKKVQRVKVQYGVDGSATDASTTNPLPVDQTNTTVADGGALPAKGVQVGGTDGSVFQVLSTDNAGRLNANINGTVPVSAAALPLPAGASTAAKQPALGTAGTASADVISVQGVASMTALKVDGSGVTQPVSGTVTASGPLTDTQLRASAVPTTDSQTIADNAGFTDGTSKVFPVGLIFDEVAGTALTENDIGAARMDAKRAAVGVLEDATTRGQRAAVSAGGALKVDNSAVTQPVSGTVSITANSAVNVAQMAGTTTDTNSGVKSAGTQRVVLATDQPQLTNALKVDGSATTQPVSGTVTANIGASASATGLSKSHLVSAATTNATNVKASAGKLHGWYIYNSNAAARKIAFHNTAGTPTAGASVVDSLVIPPTSAANAFSETGIAFSTGIAFTTVTGLADSDNTAVALNDLVINLYYI